MVLKFGTLRNMDQKYLETFEMSRCGRMEKIRWTNNVRNEEILTKSQGGEDKQ
jgi:hypothetical protein